MKQTKAFFSEIEKIIQSLQFETITGERKSILQPLISFKTKFTIKKILGST
jgi:hypothetical protein